MKNYIFIFCILLFSSCNQECEVVSNGFAPQEGQTVMMGSQASVDVVIAMDKAWAARDYETLKSFIADGALMQFEDGQVANNGDEFISIIDKQYQDGLAEEIQENGSLDMPLQLSHLNLKVQIMQITEESGLMQVLMDLMETTMSGIKLRTEKSFRGHKQKVN